MTDAPPAGAESFRDAVDSACRGVGAERWTVGVSDGGTFVTAWPREGGDPPQQGWKIHLSAAPDTTATVLARALPVLVAAGRAFKVVSTRRALAEMNEGRRGLGQVGKFVTVYPGEDADAVALAVALRDVTHDLRGPRITSDRPLSRRGIVHYRYGSSGGLQMRTPLGAVVEALRAPDGSLIPDERGDGAVLPPWVDDPFVAAGVAAPETAPDQVVAGRYVLVAPLHTSPRSTVHLALDVQEPARRVVKRVRDDGTGSRERLFREADVLRRLASDPRFPTCFDIVDDGEWCSLVLEDVVGTPLDRVLATCRTENRLPPLADALAWVRALTDLIATMHAAGLTHGDVKPSNIIVTDDAGLRLVDFELARDIDHASPANVLLRGCGTRGYIAPQQRDGAVPQAADDLYSIGAVLYLLLTGADPSSAPDVGNLLRRPLITMNPAVSADLSAVVEQCLAHESEDRIGSAAALSARLTRIAVRDSGTRQGGARPPRAAGRSRRTALALAHRLGDLVAAGMHGPGTRTERFIWETRGPLGDRSWTVDLNDGAAGAVLALAELVAVLDDHYHRSALERAARDLATVPRPAGARLPGLYVGEAGVAVAQLRAGQVLGAPDLVASACAAVRHVDETETVSPDLFNGLAGRLRALVILGNQSDDTDLLREATVIGRRLADLTDRDDEALAWPMPAGFGSLSGRRLLGYAHGAAGIADVLLDLYASTADECFLRTALGVGRLLRSTAVAGGPEGDGVNWPAEAGYRPQMGFWCHGAAGVSRFLLRLGQVSGLEWPTDLALRSASVLARGARWAGPTQCHGLSGMIEGLLDLHAATGDERHLAEAGSMVELLAAFLTVDDGVAYFATSPEASSPGFSVGCAGVIAALLRFADPSAPHLLSVEAFRRGAARCRAPVTDNGSSSCEGV